MKSSEPPYQFHVDHDAGGAIAERAGTFSVSFGGRSKVRYTDEWNDLQLSADFDEDGNPEVGTDLLMSRIEAVPPALDETAYAGLVLQRILAAGTWDRRIVAFRGAMAHAIDPPTASI